MKLVSKQSNGVTSFIAQSDDNEKHLVWFMEAELMLFRVLSLLWGIGQNGCQGFA